VPFSVSFSREASLSGLAREFVGASSVNHVFFVGKPRRLGLFGALRTAALRCGGAMTIDYQPTDFNEVTVVLRWR